MVEPRLTLGGQSSTIRSEVSCSRSREREGGAVLYDIVIKGGHVLDPGQGLDGQLDIGISNGQIAAIEPELSAADAARVIEVRGTNRHVVPG